MNGKSVAKDLQRLVKLIGSVSDGQARVIRAEPPEGSGHRDPDEVDYDISMIVVVEIQPKGGPYRGGTFRFEIAITEDYPCSAPYVRCLTPIFHPNIDPTTEHDNICLNLFSEWEPSFSLSDCIQGFLFLLYNPNTSDPLSPLVRSDVREKAFLENVKRSLFGERIGEFSFERNLYRCDIPNGQSVALGEEERVPQLSRCETVNLNDTKRNMVIAAPSGGEHGNKILYQEQTERNMLCNKFCYTRRFEMTRTCTL